MKVGAQSQVSLDRPLTVPLRRGPAARRGLADGEGWGRREGPLAGPRRQLRALLSRPGVLPLCGLLFGALFLLVLGLGSAPLSLLCGLSLVAASGALLLGSDYRFSLRVERGRLFLLRNGVAVFDASVLPGGGHHLQLEGGRLEALRCRPGEPPSYVFGLPILGLSAADAARVRLRIEAERQALEHTSRQIELLDDPDVQAHLRGRLGAPQGRPAALHAALQAASLSASPAAQAARAVLGYSSSASAERRGAGWDEDQRTGIGGRRRDGRS